ncbi:TPA: hypothetical protein ACXNG6_003828, partial [Stenotrophomonas maltophilia]
AAICWNLLLMVLLMVLLMMVGADRWSARGRIPLQRNGLWLRSWRHLTGVGFLAYGCRVHRPEFWRWSSVAGGVQPIAVAMPGQSRAASRVRRCMVEPRWEVPLHPPERGNVVCRNSCRCAALSARGHGLYPRMAWIY